MKNRFSIGEAAKITGLTSETLRHYDRIGLVQPHEKDHWTGYRYYSEQEIVRLNTVQALRLMDLSLKEIKEVLAYSDLQKVVAFLKQAEIHADEKISKLQYAKTKIGLARADYEKKIKRAGQDERFFIQRLPRRVIMLSETMSFPSVENLWDYHSHFYRQVDASQKPEYSFEDMAGVYTCAGKSRLFAVCLRYPEQNRLTVLPQGLYLCAYCSEENKEAVLCRLLKTAQEEYGAAPDFTVQLVVISGILQWNYQIQVPLGRDEGCLEHDAKL